MMRPVDLMHQVSRQWPGVFAELDRVRSRRHETTLEWPDWCYAPHHAVIDAMGAPLDRQSFLTCAVGATAAWRPTQSVYRFDPDVEKALVSTDMRGPVPVDHLLRLPEWCVYCESLGGFFAYLDILQDTGLHLLCVVLPDRRKNRYMCLPLLGGATVEESLISLMGNGALCLSTEFPLLEILMDHADILRPIVSLLLYLCADDPDMVATRGRGKVTPKERIGRDGKPYMPAANKPEVWEVGFRLGATLRSDAGTSGGGGHVRPHVRRAHWHSFWTGQKPDQKLRLRWVAPILVKGGPDRPTIRHVETP